MKPTLKLPEPPTASPFSRWTPTRIFAFFAFAYFFVWTVVPTIAQDALARFDTYETAMAARTWRVATLKHPGLSFDWLHWLFSLFGRSVFTVHVAAISWAILGLWAVWRLSREFVSERFALLVVFATATYRYFNIGLLNYTPSSPGPALTALGVCAFYFAATRGRTRYWAALGAVLAANLYAKYSAGVDVVVLLAFSLLSARVRRCWKTPGPWTAIAVFAFACAPLVAFFVRQNFEPLFYSESRFADSVGVLGRLERAAVFLVGQIVLFLPIGIGLFPLTSWFWRFRSLRKNGPSDAEIAERPEKTDAERAFDAAFLNFVVWVPVAIYLALVLATGAKFRNAYGAPLWPLYGVWLVGTLRLDVSPKNFARCAALSGAIILVEVVSLVATYSFALRCATKPASINWPARTIAAYADRVWQENVLGIVDGPVGGSYGGSAGAFGRALGGSGGGAFGSGPAFVSGYWKLVGPATFFSRWDSTPICYYCDQERLADPATRPTTPEVSDVDLNLRGGLVLWEVAPDEPRDASAPDWVRERYPNAVAVPGRASIPYRMKRFDDAPTLCVRAAVVPPKTAFLPFERIAPTVPADAATDSDASANAPADATPDSDASVPADSTPDSAPSVPADAATDSAPSVPADATTDSAPSVPADATR